MQAYIRSVGAYLPGKILSNDDLAQTLDTSDEWFFSHTGIHERRIAEDDEAASDLGYGAAMSALNNLQLQDGSTISASDIDLLLLATSTPDYPGLPATACIVQERIGAENAGAMDIVAACTGFIYALETAKNFIISGSARNVLVIGSEVYSKIVNWKDRSTCVLFGDGAGAVLLSAAPEGSLSGIFGSVLGSKGGGCSASALPRRGKQESLPAGDYSRRGYLPSNERQTSLYLCGTGNYRHYNPASGHARSGN